MGANKKWKKSFGKGSVAFTEGVYTIRLRVSRLPSEEVSAEIWEIWIESHRHIHQKHMAPRSKIREREGFFSKVRTS